MLKNKAIKNTHAPKALLMGCFGVKKDSFNCEEIVGFTQDNFSMLGFEIRELVYKSEYKTIAVIPYSTQSMNVEIIFAEKVLRTSANYSRKELIALLEKLDRVRWNLLLQLL